jgi:cyclic nucleotide-binding protein
MEYSDVKESVARCPDLVGLDEGSRASLFWRGDEETVRLGRVVYSEGTPLDDTFCLLLSGELLVQHGEELLGRIAGCQIFGEMAYFTASRSRSATVRVGSPQAIVLKIHLTEAELGSPRFSPLKKYLGQQAWDRFVSGSQTNV